MQLPVIIDPRRAIDLLDNSTLGDEMHMTVLGLYVGQLTGIVITSAELFCLYNAVRDSSNNFVYKGITVYAGNGAFMTSLNIGYLSVHDVALMFSLARFWFDFMWLNQHPSVKCSMKFTSWNGISLLPYHIPHWISWIHGAFLFEYASISPF